MTPFADEVSRCRAAQLDWQTRPIRERLRSVRRFRHAIVERTDALTATVEADLGRRPGEVVATDLLPTAAATKWLERRAAGILAPRRATGTPLWLLGCRDTVHRRPHGVVGVIGTWNYPVFLTVVPILHAVTAGNGVLFKPSERAPRTAAVLAELFTAFPTNLVQTLPATREAGPQLAEADIDFLHFTGSEPIGRQLAARLGERLVPSALELSGCDALVVLADANVELAARCAWYAATLNDGRTCMAARRAVVHQSVCSSFASAVTQLATATPGALVLDPPANDPVRFEAHFGPRLVVLPFDTIDDALRIIAESPFRLTASVFTSDPRSAQTLAAARLPVGVVTVNDVIVPTAHPDTPFGGRKASGWGTTQGIEGLLQMTVPQVVSVRRGLFRPHVDAHLTRDPAADDVTRGMLRLAHAATWQERWQGLKQMLGGMRRLG